MPPERAAESAPGRVGPGRAGAGVDEEGSAGVMSGASGLGSGSTLMDACMLATTTSHNEQPMETYFACAHIAYSFPVVPRYCPSRSRSAAATAIPGTSSAPTANIRAATSKSLS